MRAPVLAFSTVALWLAAASAGVAQEARALIERAVQAHGGKEKLAQIGAESMKWKGILFDPNPEPFTAEVQRQWPDRARNVYRLTLPNGVYTASTIVNGADAWMQTEDGFNKEPERISTYTHQELETAMYVDEQVGRLLPLLDGSGFELSLLPQTTVLGRPARGVNVRAKGHPDVKLYFDADSGLLVKKEYRTIKEVEDHGGEVLISYVYDNYQTADPAAADEAALKAEHISTDPEALLAYLRKRTLGDVDEEDIGALIRRLGDRSFAVREKATASLIARGRAAVPALQEALKSPDSETSDRAARCIKQIGSSASDTATAAVLRLISLRQPSGAVEAILAYLPSAPDKSVATAATMALTVVGVHDGKPDKLIEAAVHDKSPARRAAAAEVLGRARPGAQAQQLLLTGIKYPTRVAEYENGSKKAQFDVTEIRFFTALDPRTFRRP